jgi:murein DD-endopeptidase MepM/ murein hydrolase activator NlpD
MSAFTSGCCSRIALRLALTGVAAGLLAGCSNSERLSDAFGSPFGTVAQNNAPAPEWTPREVSAAPVGAVQTQPLSPPVQTYAAAPDPAPVTAAAHASAAAARSFAGWSPEGGSMVTVGQGETAEVLARRYGVPVEALVRANGFAAASEVRPGTHLVVPVYNAALAASGARAKEAPQQLARAVVSPPPARRQQAQPLMQTPARPASRPVVAQVERSPQKAQAIESAKPPTKTLALAPAAPEPKKSPPVAKAESQKPVKVETAAIESHSVSEIKAETTKASLVADGANPEFRWPARGRIIQGFKPGGNDGINIALPSGTQVKAAESGVVAYAGNELKGYGNLVLIRHPNGFVSAYANNGDIEVKRGDAVKRGQVIAKSGQTGNVSSPQLHFELRKGATPVDPTQYLAGL